MLKDSGFNNVLHVSSIIFSLIPITLLGMVGVKVSFESYKNCYEKE